ncbi:MAG: DUF1800 domain-containing protein [Ignavibacteriales bacterium]|nr:DUF1800 domain-containing protein [Ignavibacteriales bacterium]
MTDWNIATASHLLSRTLFGYTKEDLDFALSMPIDEYVDNYLLADLSTPQSPGFWVNDPSNYNNSVRSRELTYWWYNLMLTQGHSLREKMVLFWHNHFVSEISVVDSPQLMYHQNKLFREFAFGNFKELTKQVSINPAMLIYLDNTKNRKEDPNENYARELMELFTLGIGNYSENDIVEAAKALTGWQVEGLESYFNEERFDDSVKNFLGKSGNFNYTDIIEIIFQKPEAANFLCEKLYKEFIFIEPDQDIINQLAEIFRSNNYELKPVLSALFKSEHFQSSDFIGAKIKSPIEFIIPLIRQFRIINPEYEYLRDIADDIGQTLFSPPNVAGWEGDKTWISTNTLPARNIFSDRIINTSHSDLKILEYARTFDSSENAIQFVHDVAEVFFSYKLTENRIEYLLQILLDGAEVYDWSTYNENSAARLESFFKSLCRLSEYQLT